MKRTSRLRWTLLTALLIGMLGVGIAAVHNVPTAPTANDHQIGIKLLKQAGYGDLIGKRANQASFEDQVRFIQAVQDAVITASPETVLIPFDRPREPKDLVAHGHGECGDRSRVAGRGVFQFDEALAIAFNACFKQGNVCRIHGDRRLIGVDTGHVAADRIAIG